MKKRFLSKYDGHKLVWLRDAKKFILILVAVFIVLQFIIGFSTVKGDSMLPTLKEGEIVLYTRLGGSYKQGDVVSVRVPSGTYYVKRVIATAGDTVDINGGKVIVNGIVLNEDYCTGETLPDELSAVDYPYTLAENQVFVLGDNRVGSMDSRTFGAVNERQIKGKLWFYGGFLYIKYMY